MISIQRPMFFDPETGTSATALIHKGFLPIKDGTCSGTQLEHDKVDVAVPDVQVEQEHRRNENNLYKTIGYTTFSGVPVETPESASSLSRKPAGGQT